MSATTTAMSSTTPRQRTTNGSSEAAVTDEGRKTDKLLDSHTRCLVCLSQLTFLKTHVGFARWEFGGPWGVTAMMIGFPMLMYYLWICLWFYDGRLVVPTSVDGIKPFIDDMWSHIRDVSPSLFAHLVVINTIISPSFSFV